MNFDLDGTFPVHQPDPLDPKNLEILRAAVREHHADLGIAPDGDGDRYFFVDETGEIVRQEILRGIMAQIALRETPGATVCYDIRPGKITKDLIEEAGGTAVVTRVGHSHIKKAMIESGAVFGGESSGHYFYKFPFGTFEAPATFVTKFLRWVSQQTTPLSQVIAPYRAKYANSGEINSEVHDVGAVIEKIQQRYADGEISLLDGVTVTYPNYWFNVRGSNTEPLIRLNLEATTKELMEQKRDEVLQYIRTS
jgi:phosphomannomutase